MQDPETPLTRQKQYSPGLPHGFRVQEVQTTVLDFSAVTSCFSQFYQYNSVAPLLNFF